MANAADTKREFSEANYESNTNPKKTGQVMRMYQTAQQ